MGKLGLVLKGEVKLSKSLIQFSDDGLGCVPSLLLVVEVMKIMAASFKRSHSCTAALSPSDPAAGHRRPETPEHSWTCLGQSLVGLLLLSHGFWCTRLCLCPPRGCFPVLCKFWQLYGGINGNLLQEGLCHTQVCCTQRPCPCPCSRLLLTCTFTENIQTQLWLSLCGVSGS